MRKRVFNEVRTASTRERSMKGEVIVTTSGMLDGGPVLRYLMKERENRKSAVLIPGYQAEGSNGRTLLDKGKIAVETEVIGEKELVDVKCETQVFDLSAHADHAELLAFIRACDPEKVIFMHGDNRQLLADELKGEMEVYMPMTGEELRSRGEVLKLADLLAEDVGDGDITTELLIGEERGEAVITTGEDCVLAGLQEATDLFRHLGLETRTDVKDGSTPGQGPRGPGHLWPAASHPSRRTSGVELPDAHERHRHLDPLPGGPMPEGKFLGPHRRHPEDHPVSAFTRRKHVRLGGGDPHRSRLDDGILIKDNHLAVVGSITQAVERTKSLSFSKKVEVEVETLGEAEEAANCRGRHHHARQHGRFRSGKGLSGHQGHR
ncbi:MAG: hypothetical protein MZV70_01390 [Desulfobacterales bacterium]|nr:hypothetical protein [Desulfobacterales bacterium]